MNFRVATESQDRLSVALDQAVLAELCEVAELPTAALGRLAVHIGERQLQPVQRNETFPIMSDVTLATFTAWERDEQIPVDQVIRMDMASIRRISAVGIRHTDYAYLPGEDLLSLNASSTFIHELFHLRHFIRRKEMLKELSELKWYQVGRSARLEWQLQSYRPNEEEPRVQAFTHDLFKQQPGIFRGLLEVTFHD